MASLRGAALGTAAVPGISGAMNPPDRAAAIFVFLLGALALAVAFGAQDYLGMAPCELCLWERWPYRILALLGLLAFWLPPRPRRALLWVAFLALLCGTGIAFLHIGVEQHWWPSPLPECSASNLVTGNLSALIASLPSAPAKPCDAPNFLIPGLPISFAMMDLILAAVCAVGLGAYLTRSSAR
jgi:disulfide bond formation protein DsbB